MNEDRRRAMKRHPAGWDRDPIDRPIEVPLRHEPSPWPERITFGAMFILTAAIIALVIFAYLPGGA